MICLPLADDCGVNLESTQIIVKGIDLGRLRGTSLIACGQAVEVAAQLLGERYRENPNLKIGVHLNLLEGRSVANPSLIPCLVHSNGRFRYSLGGLCQKLLVLPSAKKTEFVAQVGIEWQAQITLIQTMLAEHSQIKNPPIYLDGHQHVHAIPALLPALAQILARITPVHVRVPCELRYYSPASLSQQVLGSARRELLHLWGARLKPYLASHGIPFSQFFIGAFCSGSMTAKRLEAGLQAVSKTALRGSTVEIMLHPGKSQPVSGISDSSSISDSSTFSHFYAAKERDQEASLIFSPEYQEILARYDPAWQNL